MSLCGTWRVVTGLGRALVFLCAVRCLMSSDREEGEDEARSVPDPRMSSDLESVVFCFVLD